MISKINNLVHFCMKYVTCSFNY